MSAEARTEPGPLALICGGGSLPLAVADSVAARGREVVLFPLHGAAKPADFAARPSRWLHVGQFGKFVRLARAAGCREVVLIGSLARPAVWQIRPDWRTLRLMPRIVAAFRGGDDHLLSGIARIMEEHGFRLVGAHEVAPQILTPASVLGAVQPAPSDRDDIALGLDFLRASAAFDVGQAVVVADRHVLAVEAAEGTDEMLARVAQLRASGRVRMAAGRGVMVKAPKQGQDRRFDLPAIGPHTVEGAARAGLAGIAIAAGETLLAEPARLVSVADRAGIFVVGVTAGPVA
ncbi:MAG: UDP-2,3-diacylglucosamine diphosphatase LpxI [Pseudolabrys sp.]|nr:UDP-2,3-diacylglucosamine diphosphatase LpxI [Pseudolabrys sp.]